MWWVLVAKSRPGNGDGNGNGNGNGIPESKDRKVIVG